MSEADERQLQEDLAFLIDERYLKVVEEHDMDRMRFSPTQRARHLLMSITGEGR